MYCMYYNHAVNPCTAIPRKFCWRIPRSTQMSQLSTEKWFDSLLKNSNLAQIIILSAKKCTFQQHTLCSQTRFTIHGKPWNGQVIIFGGGHNSNVQPQYIDLLNNLMKLAHYMFITNNFQDVNLSITEKSLCLLSLQTCIHVKKNMKKKKKTPNTYTRNVTISLSLLFSFFCFRMFNFISFLYIKS